MKRTKKVTAFEGIMAGANEALAYVRGEADPKQYRVHIPEDLDVNPPEPFVQRGCGPC